MSEEEKVKAEVAEEENTKANEKDDKQVKKEAKQKTKDKIAELEAEIKKLKMDVLMAQADSLNFQKRVKDEAIKDRKYASMNLVSDLITPLDYLVIASNMETEDPNMKNFLIGFKMIANQLVDVLVKDGLQPIECNVDMAFDPTVMHAVEKEHVDGKEKDIVIQVIQKGYKYKDRIIKPAMVKVSE